MNEQGDATMSGSRRKFLRTAGVAASGAALIGANQRSAGQVPGSETARAARRDGAIVRASAQSPDPEQASAGGAAGARQRQTRNPRPLASVRSTPFVRQHLPKCI